MNKYLVLILSLLTTILLIMTLKLVNFDNEYSYCNNTLAVACAQLVINYSAAIIMDLAIFVCFIKVVNSILLELNDYRIIIPYFTIIFTFPLIHIPFYQSFSLVAYLMLIGIMELIIMFILTCLALLYEKSVKFRDWLNKEIGIDEGSYLVF